jgi:hypothetical protein
MTDNHNYEEPEPGMSEWHVPINENFDRLDSDVEIRDVEGNLEDYAPKDGAKFYSTDTEQVYISSEGEWQQVSSSGKAPTFDTVRSKQINNVVYASEFDSKDLSASISAALNDLPNGRGRIRVTRKSDGSAWSWNSTLYINPLDYEGVDIDIDWNAKIDDDSEEWSIIVDTNGKLNGQGQNVKLNGGIWSSSAQNPSGWLKIVDSIENTVCPNFVKGYYNDGTDSTAVLIENRNKWSEGNLIKGAYQADRIVDTAPASVTGGENGTESFHDNKFEKVTGKFKDFGIRCRGKFMYCHIQKPTLFFGDKDSAAIILDAPRMDGTTIQSMKAEDTVGFEETVGFRLDSQYDGWYGPTVFGGHVFAESNAKKNGARNPIVMQTWSRDKGLRIEEMRSGDMVHITASGSIRVDGSVTGRKSDMGVQFASSSVEFKKKNQRIFNINHDSTVTFQGIDLTKSDAPTPEKAHVYSSHDGSGSKPPGLYRSEPSENRWKKVGKKSTFILY